MEPLEKKLLTIKEAAKLLGVTPLTLRNWDNNGKLEATRHPINNYRVYKREDIDRLLTGMATNKEKRPPRPSKNAPRKISVTHITE